MLRRFGMVTLGLGLVLALSSAARAGTVVDFDAQGYASGQDLEGAAIGIVTLTSELGNLEYTTFDLDGLRGDAGGSADIYLSFSAPVSNLFVTAGDSGVDFDAFRVHLFEFGSDAPLGSFDTPLFDTVGDPDLFTLHIPGAANVGRVVFDPGNSGVLPGVAGDFGGVLLKRIEFDAGVTAVPLPGAAWMGLSLLGVLGALRRRKSP